MTAAESTSWLDMGPAEFDAKRLPKGYKRPAEDQGALFFAAVPPKPAKPVKVPDELPGQGDLFGGEL